MAPEIRVIGITGIPAIEPGDDLVDIICTAVERQGVEVSEGDIFVVTHKVVSKAEGRLVPLKETTPSEFAFTIAGQTDKDPHHLEAILREAKRTVKMDRGVLITETRHGLVCANSGVDQSNIPGDTVALLPIDPDRSARRIRSGIRERMGKEVATIVTDTFGRPWRRGLTNVAVGVAGLKPIADLRGQKDGYGYILQATEIAIADELASAAELVMGKSKWVPVALIKGYDYPRGDGAALELVRPPSEDLFR